MLFSSLRGRATALVVVASTPAFAQTALPTITISSAKRMQGGAAHGNAQRPQEAPLPAPPVEVATPAPPAPVPPPQSQVPIEQLRPASADTTKLLQDTPGVSMYEAGGVSRLPAIHGMADDRLKIIVGGVQATSACANHMNPPLSYVDPNNVGKIDVQAGVVSVSKGGDSIGGSIIVEPKSPVFAPSRIPGRAAGQAAEGAPGVGAAETVQSWPLIVGWPLHGKGERFGPNEEVYVSGQVSSFFRSTNTGVGTSGTFNVATDHFAVLYNGAWQRGLDYHAGGDGYKVLSTGFITENHDGTLAYQNDGHQLSLRGAIQNIPYQAFVNQRMDMTSNRAYQVDGKYSGAYDWGKVDFHAFYQFTGHKMGMLYDKQPDNMPMATNGKDFGYALKLEHKPDDNNLLRVGSEFHGFRLNDYWEPIPDVCYLSKCLGPRLPYVGFGGGLMTVNDYTTLDSGGNRTVNMSMLMMGPYTQWNINNGRRDRLGHYAEWISQWTPKFSTELGLRNEIVMMGVGQASSYDPRDPAPMPMLTSGTGWWFSNNRWTPMDMANPDSVAASKFNRQNRSKVDVNFDMTARAKYEPDEFTTFDVGYSRKTRSPNLYERYTWVVGSMSTAMVNWFGDGNGYTGNLNLKPEVAHTVGVTAAWRSPTGDWDARVAPYYSYIENYIDADRYAAFRFTGPAIPGPYTFQQLQFRNHKAIIYGFDVSGRLRLLESPDYGTFTATALVNYTYGRDLDMGNVSKCNGFSSSYTPTVGAIAADQLCYFLAPYIKQGDGLYNIMPLNSRLGVEHRLGGWSSRLELQLVDKKSHVSIQRNELQTPAYALLNLRLGYEWENMRIDFGVDNLADALYFPALGGFYFTGYKYYTNTNNAPFGVAGPVPGPGRNIFAGLTAKF